MRLTLTLGRLTACLGLALLSTLAAAQSPTEDLQRQVTALQEELARLKAAGTADPRLAELYLGRHPASAAAATEAAG